jgi:hypothetical protein
MAAVAPLDLSAFDINALRAMVLEHLNEESL